MSVRRHTIYNIGGATVPIILALVVIPLYLHRIGEARYGILAIVWLLLGYFGMFDLGLSRATANQIARLHQASTADRGDVFWTALILNTALGTLGGVLLYCFGGPLFDHWLKMSPSLRGETTAAMPWIATAVPVATVTSVLTGVLEGRQQFGVVNSIQASGTVLFQVVPLAAAFLVSPALQVIIPICIIVRTLSVVPLAIAVKSTLPIHGVPRIRLKRVRELLAYGSWVTITNIVGPVIDSLDRFLIGATLGAASVAYYAVPLSLVGRTQIIPRALSRTLFPYLSADSPDQARRRAIESVTAMGAIMIPVSVVSIFLMRPFLTMWIDPRFAAQSSAVGETLLCGVWLNGLASIPFAMLQAQGRPDIVAKFHVAELPPFVFLLWYGLRHFGLEGVAVAWAARAGIDAILLFWAAAFGYEMLKRLTPAAIIVLCAWISVRSLATYSTAVQLTTDAALVISAAVWSLRSSDRVRHEVMNILRRVPR